MFLNISMCQVLTAVIFHDLRRYAPSRQWSAFR